MSHILVKMDWLIYHYDVDYAKKFLSSFPEVLQEEFHLIPYQDDYKFTLSQNLIHVGILILARSRIQIMTKHNPQGDFRNIITLVKNQGKFPLLYVFYCDRDENELQRQLSWEQPDTKEFVEKDHLWVSYIEPKLHHVQTLVKLLKVELPPLEEHSVFTCLVQ